MKTSNVSWIDEDWRIFLRNRIQRALLTLAVLIRLSTIVQADEVYVWSNDGTIQKFSTNGAASLVATNLSGWNGPVGLACDNFGNLYAAVSGYYIWRLTPNGNSSLVAPGIDSLFGLAFDSKGGLVVTLPNYGEIIELDYLQGHGYWLNSHTPNQNGSRYPIELAFDGSGNFYVVNNTNPCPFVFLLSPSPGDNSIEKFSPDFTDLGTFATNLNQPWGLAFGNGGNLYVANSGTSGSLANTILRILPSGRIFTFANASSGLNSPQGIAFDSAGNLFVANSGNGTIQKFTPGGVSSVFASGLNAPASIAIFPGLNVWSAKAIQLINPALLPGGVFQFGLVENAGLVFNVLATTNMATALTNWTALGSTTEISPGQYQFADPQATNSGQRFYRIVAP